MKIQSSKHFLNLLENDISLPLPGIEAQVLMAPSGRLNTDGKPYDFLDRNPKLSAVLVLLFVDPSNNLRLLLIQRPEYEGVHSAQVSFPGGKKEDSDPDLLQTALREAAEEVNVNSNDIRIIRPLTDLYIPPSNFLVQPYLAFSDSIGELMHDGHEVKEILTPEFQSFLNPESKKFGTFRTGAGTHVKYPFYEIENRRIWGATAMIISEIEALIKRL